ncbi:hypothetical protein [Cellulomonas sp.]|uniref:hypothetical protein n=1 Tax=Cellulomonas sp. TaxID=40001 RepID=UPI003BA8565C
MDVHEVNEWILRSVRDLPSEALLSKDSSVDLATLIAQGAATMVQEGRTAPDDLAQAEQNAALLLASMNDVRIASGYEFFSETTVAEARSRLCPGLWPFC